MTDRVQTEATGLSARTGDAARISLALLLGAFILFGTAFARIDAAHDAAHDSRHSFAFPCH